MVEFKESHGAIKKIAQPAPWFMWGNRGHRLPLQKYVNSLTPGYMFTSISILIFWKKKPYWSFVGWESFLTTFPSHIFLNCQHQVNATKAGAENSGLFGKLFWPQDTPILGGGDCSLEVLCSWSIRGGDPTNMSIITYWLFHALKIFCPCEIILHLNFL